MVAVMGNVILYILQRIVDIPRRTKMFINGYDEDTQQELEKVTKSAIEIVNRKNKEIKQLKIKLGYIKDDKI